MVNTGVVQTNGILILAAVLAVYMALALGTVYYKRRVDKKEQEAAVRETELAREAEKIFERVIPGAFLKLLKIKSYSELEVGAQQYFSAVIMDVNKADRSGTVIDKKAEEVFASINGMLRRVVPVISRQGGLIHSFEGGGISALFEDSCEQALTAVVSMYEEMNAMGNEEYDTVAAGLTKGLVMIGVVGHEERASILLLSEAKEFAGFLRRIGYAYYARILVTKDLLDSMGEEALRFNSRILGKIYIRSKGCSVMVCDVFDGDKVEIRNKKRRTRIVFEKGVELFWAGKLELARLHFVEVLKLDAADRAAAFYLLRCDGCLNKEEKWQEYIELY